MKYSILVNSCDAYSDVWPIFFHILKRTWLDELPKIYLNTEKLTYSDSDIPITCLNLIQSAPNVPWGKRLLESLNRIDSDYILMLLEDFLFEEKIRTEVIDKCVQSLEDNEKILAFQLVPSGEFDKGNLPLEDHRYPGFARRKRFDAFTMVAGPTLWRKIDLMKLTKDVDDPWAWEFFGSFRTWLYGKEIYCWRSKETCILKYDVDHGGAVHRGKWVGYKMRELTDKYEFTIEQTTRDIEEDWMLLCSESKNDPFYKRMDSILKNRFSMISNILYGAKIRLGR